MGLDGFLLRFACCWLGIEVGLICPGVVPVVFSAGFAFEC